MTARAVAIALAALSSACATVGSQARDVCPEYRGLVCQKGDLICERDAARGCLRCVCRGYTEPDASGTLRPPMDGLVPTAPPAR